MEGLVQTEAYLFVCNFDMALKTESVICRMALWDCFGVTNFDPVSCVPLPMKEAIASLRIVPQCNSAQH